MYSYFKTYVFFKEFLKKETTQCHCQLVALNIFFSLIRSPFVELYDIKFKFITILHMFSKFSDRIKNGQQKANFHRHHSNYEDNVILHSYCRKAITVYCNINLYVDQLALAVHILRIFLRLQKLALKLMKRRKKNENTLSRKSEILW